MNILYAIVFIVLLVCTLLAGWHARKFIERVENMERVLKRRDLPNPVKAGLEDITALAGMEMLSSAEDEKLITGLMWTVIQASKRRRNSEWFVQEIERISALLRHNGKDYNPDVPLEER